MKRFFTVFALIGLAGCQGVSSYFPGSKVVKIDGVEYSVRPLSNKNSWQAGLNRPTGASLLVIDPTIYAGNVKAMEAATGCAVLRETIQNSDNFTIAAVDCSKSTAKN
ncbi:hypothetical protein FP026_22960 [Rhizobium tropici]|uniref:Uncharacterized protein n=1 Tax=Rhizobium tropici TaxID=398 RepID=A0A5B0VVV0_RHITR|nr:hypothetical protein [Rhizobium tropici]KAA1178061.1 hypothetical protein FP026_22960 [Rhizobium tropici]